MHVRTGVRMNAQTTKGAVMAETETETETKTETETETDANDDAQDGQVISPDEARKMRAALKRANKEAETARLKLKEREDADLSEIERATKAAADAEARAQRAETEALRLRVGAAKGLTVGQTRRLIGDTQEELEQDADALISDLGGTTKPGDRPKEKLVSGTTRSSQTEELDPRKLAEQIPRI
jgi:hypothetical protein